MRNFETYLKTDHTSFQLRRHITRRRRIPFGEDILPRLGDLIPPVRVVEQHPVARRRPGRAVQQALSARIQTRQSTCQIQPPKI